MILNSYQICGIEKWIKLCIMLYLIKRMNLYLKYPQNRND